MVVQLQPAQAPPHPKLSVETPDTQARPSKSLYDTTSKKMGQKKGGRESEENTGSMYLPCQFFKVATITIILAGTLEDQAKCS